MKITYARRLGAAIAAPAMAAAIAAAPLVWGTAAQAAETCTGSGDVTVVIDYHGLDRKDAVVCAPADAGKTAQQVLADAKVGLEGTAKYGDAVICRVEGLPDKAAEPCTDMPSSDAYWTLWWSDGSKGTWTYAQEGASTLKIPGGGFVGLSYQEGKAQVAPSLAAASSTKELSGSAVPKAAVDTDDSGSTTWVWVAAGVVALMLLALGAVTLRRKASGGPS